MSRNWKPTEEQHQQIIDGYASDEIGIRELADVVGIGKDAMMRYAKSIGIEKVPKEKLPKQTRSIIDTWNGECSLNELAKKANVSLACVQKRLKKIGIDTQLYIEKNPYYRPGKTPRDKAFFEDIDNPSYTSIELAEKYGVSDVAIQRWRKKRHGTFKPQIDTSTHLTTPERRTKEILDDLDLTYFTHHLVIGWNVDFYLGHKGIIEVDGQYWHSKEKNVKKDKRKISELKSNGYKILILKDDDFSDLPYIQSQIKKFWVSLIREGKKTTM